MADIDAIIVGAGVIGLACARAIAMAGHSVLILESEAAIGTGTSSRNSEVIHAGLYYPIGSLKARLCVEGRKQLYAFCRSNGVSHRQCGKLIVATREPEVAGLLALKAKGEANGCDDLRMLSADEARAMEPEVSCLAALHSPSTGIVDSHGLMLSLLGDAEDAGAMLALHAPLEQVRCLPGGGFIVHVGGADPMEISCRFLVNAAGLQASDVARRIDGLPADTIPVTRLAKGNYVMLTGRSPFSHLVYPAPQTHGLGIHLTLDMGGQARFGPDVEWIDEIDYRVDPSRVAAFDAAIRSYWPGLPRNMLVPGYSGIRPKIGGPDDPAADFRIDGPQTHGIDGLVNLFGIESPGLTSSLAIARMVSSYLLPESAAADAITDDAGPA